MADNPRAPPNTLKPSVEFPIYGLEFSIDQPIQAARGDTLKTDSIGPESL